MLWLISCCKCDHFHSPSQTCGKSSIWQFEGLVKLAQKQQRSIVCFFLFFLMESGIIRLALKPERSPPRLEWTGGAASKQINKLNSIDPSPLCTRPGPGRVVGQGQCVKVYPGSVNRLLGERIRDALALLSHLFLEGDHWTAPRAFTVIIHPGYGVQVMLISTWVWSENLAAM